MSQNKYDLIFEEFLNLEISHFNQVRNAIEVVFKQDGFRAFLRSMDFNLDLYGKIITVNQVSDKIKFLEFGYYLAMKYTKDQKDLFDTLDENISELKESNDYLLDFYENYRKV